ncbi:MAG: hypothetical protein WC675_01520 [Patescibacteria group bacterium]|jgi:aspartate kinase
MATIVKKFGGSSLTTDEQVMAAARAIVADHQQRTSVVVVVSARGKTTNQIRARIKGCGGDGTSERVLAFGGLAGERESAACMAAAIESLGVQTFLADGADIGLVATGEFGRGQAKTVRKPEIIIKALEEGKIVVLAGYTGVTTDGRTIDLGRSGTDTFAVVVAAAIGAKVCQIYTDVPGFFAVDPRHVPGAKLLHQITFRQALKWASAGIEVVKKESLAVADGLGMPIQVLLSPSFDSQPWLERSLDVQAGTWISKGATLEDMQGGDLDQTILAIITDLTIFNLTDVPNEPGWSAKIFGLCRDHKIVVLDIAQGLAPKGKKAAITFWVKAETGDQTERILKEASLGSIKIERRDDIGCLRIIDPRMERESGWLARIDDTLAAAKVNIEIHPTAGDVILLLIAKDKVDAAAQAIAKEFGLCA